MDNNDDQPIVPGEIPAEYHEQAVLTSLGGFFLFTAPLHPYGASRKIAAQTMGMQYPFIGEAAFDQLSRTGVYPGMLKDVAICLWLCSLEDASELTKEQVKQKVWTPNRAIAIPTEALEAAMAWAEKEEIIDLQGKKWSEASQVYEAMMAGIDASQFELRVTVPTESGPAEPTNEDPTDPKA